MTHRGISTRSGATREIFTIVNPVNDPMRGNRENKQMGIWIVIAIVLVFVALARMDSRNRSNLPTRSWNLLIGPRPREDESRARYTLRRALAAAVALAVLATPLFLISAPPDEGPDFSGKESTLEFAVFVVCGPLAVMAFFTLCTLLFSALVSAILRSDQVFDTETGEFLRR